MKIKFFNLLLLFTLLSSCSSFSWKEFFSERDSSEKRNEELLDDFEMKSELKDQFSVKKKSENKVISSTPVKAKDTKVEHVHPKAELKTPPRTAIRPLPPKRKIEPTKVAASSAETGFSYPEDYPERLKEFDKESEKFWDTFKPAQSVGEEVIFNITYLGVNTGKITMNTKARSVIGQSEVFHLNARIKTSNYYSYLYEVDDFCDSFVRTTDFVPLKFSLIQRESGQNIDDLQLFDLANLTAISLYKREANNKLKKKKNIEPIPRRYQDPLSIMYFIRGLPLEKKASYSIPVVNRGKVEEFIVKTGDKETIKTKLGSFEAFKLKVENKHDGETIKGGEMIFWFSADEKRIFLKFEAEIKIGSIKGEIEKYTP